MSEWRNNLILRNSVITGKPGLVSFPFAFYKQLFQENKLYQTVSLCISVVAFTHFHLVNKSWALTYTQNELLTPTRLSCAEKLQESPHSSVQNLCSCIYNFLGSIVHMIQLISYSEHIINYCGEASLPFASVVAAAAAWSSRRIWEQLQPQEHSTFADLVSQFCLLHRQKLKEFRIKCELCFMPPAR